MSSRLITCFPVWEWLRKLRVYNAFLTYNGNQVGGGLQYNYAGRMNILLDLGYSKKVEDAITTPTSPRYLGTTKDGLWSGKLMAYIPDAKKNTHFVEMNWQGAENRWDRIFAKMGNGWRRRRI